MTRVNASIGTSLNAVGVLKIQSPSCVAKSLYAASLVPLASASEARCPRCELCVVHGPGYEASERQYAPLSTKAPSQLLE